jgi:hypothetical protein
MSRPFAKYPAKPAFGEINEPLDAGNYIQNKKIKYSFCPPNICRPNNNVYSQSNLMTLKRANNLFFHPIKNAFNPNQLYSNLYSELDLSGNVAVISDLSGNYPVPVTSGPPVPGNLNYYYYIDPSGNLFGNTVCGFNNFRQYIVFKPPF